MFNCFTGEANNGIGGEWIHQKKNRNHWDLLNERCDDGLRIDWRVAADWLAAHDKSLGFMSFTNGNKCRKSVT